MGKYRAIKVFVDLQEETHHKYSVGDSFPYADTVKVSKERISELASVNNRRRIPLIEVISDKAVEDAFEAMPIENEESEDETAEEKIEKVRTNRKGRKSQK